jgi:hypothetical protein
MKSLSSIRFLVGVPVKFKFYQVFSGVSTKNLIEPKLYRNSTKNLIDPKLYIMPTKNLIELKHYMNFSGVHVMFKFYQVLVGFM